MEAQKVNNASELATTFCASAFDDCSFAAAASATACDDKLFAVLAIASESLAASYVLIAHTPNTTAAISATVWRT